jgi:hypothetical protein
MPIETKSRRRRWIHTGDPITNIADVPEGWSSYEPDLHKEYGYTFLQNPNA